MAHEFEHPTIGQEAVCPDGLGRVTAFQDAFPHQWIQVSTYVDDRQCKWAPHNVKLIDPYKEHPAIQSLRAIHTQPNCRHEIEAQLGEEVWHPLSMDDEHEEVMRLVAEIRDLIFEDGDSHPALFEAGFYLAIRPLIDCLMGRR